MFGFSHSRRAGAAPHRFMLLLLTAGVLFCSACAVPVNRRGYLADPTMQLTEDPLEARMSTKFNGVREGAAGGNGRAAGGGCGCGN